MLALELASYVASSTVPAGNLYDIVHAHNNYIVLLKVAYFVNGEIAETQ